MKDAEEEREDYMKNYSKQKMIKQTICFRCKKKLRARKGQHPKYSLCPSCKDYKEEFGSGSSWMDYKYIVPKR